jgi:hypothetical protein
MISLSDTHPPPEKLLALPHHAGGVAWPADISDAYQRLSTLFSNARQALYLDESDPIRLQYYLNSASNIMVSIVEALSMSQDNPLPAPFFKALAASIGSLVVYLKNALNRTEIMYEHAAY